MHYAFEGKTLSFEGKKFDPSARTFSQMRPVLLYPEKESSLAPDAPLYYMYREVKRFSNLRYDMTRILPANISGEHNKTFGHIHPVSKKGAAWSEVYEVLEGKAHFILQKVSTLGVQDAILLTAEKGDCLLIPPGYGHVTINPGRKDLLLANLVSDDFSADYSPYLHHHGACYYELTDGKLVRNKSYGNGYEIRKSTAVKFSSAFGVFAPFAGKTLLEVTKDYSKIEFLEKPETFY
ncbi:Glucose-6-phosphate isomerase [uncultured archaeon]|nr:Glucose-6-phosphate isomerase [uncultured archaeon]